MPELDDEARRGPGAERSRGPSAPASLPEGAAAAGGSMTISESLRFGHSPDPDDAYMFYGFAQEAVHVELPSGIGAPPRRWRVEHVMEDIQSLNERALLGDLEITAISAHAFPFVADR